MIVSDRVSPWYRVSEQCLSDSMRNECNPSLHDERRVNEDDFFFLCSSLRKALLDLKEEEYLLPLPFSTVVQLRIRLFLLNSRDYLSSIGW